MLRTVLTVWRTTRTFLAMMSYQRDLTLLSTESLVICWEFLRQRQRLAREANLHHLARELDRRMLDVDAEIGRRQLTLTDELTHLQQRRAESRDGVQ